jgi:hypothetical protein
MMQYQQAGKDNIPMVARPKTTPSIAVAVQWTTMLCIVVGGAADNITTYCRSEVTKDDDPYHQSGMAKDDAVYPRGSEAKDNSNYHHGSTAKVNTAYCCGGTADNDAG